MSASRPPRPLIEQRALEAVLRRQLDTPCSTAGASTDADAADCEAAQYEQMEAWARRVLRRSWAPIALRDEAYSRFLVHCWRKLSRTGGLPPRLEAMLLLSGRHVAVEAHRRRVRRRQVSLVAAADVASSAADDPVQIAQAHELADQLSAGIGQLSPARRVVLQLSLAGRSHEEIADLLGIGLGAVRQRLFKARQSLRASLG